MATVSCSTFARIAGYRQYQNGRSRLLIRRDLTLAVGFVFAVSSLLSVQGQEACKPPASSSGKSLEQWIRGTTTSSAQAIADDSLERDTSGRMSQPDDGTAESRNHAMEFVRRRDEDAVRRYRQGFFQRLRISGSWIGDRAVDGLEISSVNTALTVAIPLGSFEDFLLITPAFRVDDLNGPADVDIPDRLYDVGVDLMWRKQFNDRWGSMVAVRPAVSSDLNSSDDSMRITGRALATWQWVPERLSLLFGVVYLDRNDLPILPGVGLMWTPSPDWRFDLMFPRPKLAHRIVFEPGQREEWVYMSGKLGGRTWAVERQPGVSDQLTLRDYRLSLGWERIAEGGAGWFVEGGYVFGRELEYDVVPLTRSFGSSVTISGGLTF